MDAAAGVYTDPLGHLYVYSSYHWLSNDILRFNEYRPIPGRPEAITKRSEAWIELFEHRNYGGRFLSLFGSAKNIRDYGKIRVQGAHFDNKVSSIRFQLPLGDEYRLYEHREYNNYEEGKTLTLEGTGLTVERPNLKDWKQPRGFNDVASSSRYV